MANSTTLTKTKSYEFIAQINQKWKNEQQCYDEAKVTGKDSRTGKPTTISWPREKPQDQRKYETWLKQVQDPDTGEFYMKRDKEGSPISNNDDGN